MYKPKESKISDTTLAIIYVCKLSTLSLVWVSHSHSTDGLSKPGPLWQWH